MFLKSEGCYNVESNKLPVKSIGLVLFSWLFQLPQKKSEIENTFTAFVAYFSA